MGNINQTRTQPSLLGLGPWNCVTKMKNILIGVGHKFRRGKDTTAEYLRDVHEFEIWHLCDAIYAECRGCHVRYTVGRTGGDGLEINGSNYTHLVGLMATVRSWITSARGSVVHSYSDKDVYEYQGMDGKDGRLLQWWGMDFRRQHFGSNYWIETIRRRYEVEQPARLVVPDMRFPNEVDWVLSNGGFLLKVARRSPLGGHGNRDPEHPAETALDDFDGWHAVIENEGDLVCLYEKIESLLHNLGI